MKSSCIIFLLFFSSIRLFTQTLALSQALSFPEKCQTLISAKTSLISGFFIIEDKAPITEPKPVPISYGFKTAQFLGISILGGSITTTGLPARAKNPVFNLSSPFYNPIHIQVGQIMSLSQTRNTEKVAFEAIINRWKIASSSSLDIHNSEPSWVLLTRTYNAFDSTDTAFSVSVFSGTNNTQMLNADSWFSLENPRPETRFFLPAAEVIFQNSLLTGSCAGFFNVTPLQKTTAAIRSDSSIKWKNFYLSGGIYSADREYTNMQGTVERIINRIFIAPTLECTVPHGNDTDINMKIGGVLFFDTRRKEKWYASDYQVLSSLAGFIFEHSKNKIQLQVLYKNTNFDHFSCAVHHILFASILQLDIKGNVKPSTTEITTNFTVKPVAGFYGNIGTISLIKKDNLSESTFTAGTSIDITKSRFNWLLSTHIEISQKFLPLFATLSLKTMIR